MCPAPDLPEGWRLSVLPEVDSTNAEVLRRADLGESEGLAVRADIQTEGRGRRGRPWHSPQGNLYLSILVDTPPAVAGQVGFAAALALIDAIKRCVGDEPIDLRCKWPNDLMLDGAKVAGLLLEAVPDREQVGVGRGVNLVTTDIDDALYPVGSVFDVEDRIEPDTLAVHTCNALQSWLQTWHTLGFTPLRKAWLARAEGLHRSIVVRLPHESLEGTFDGLSEDGALMLSQDGPVVREIPAGDVFFLPTTGV